MKDIVETIKVYIRQRPFLANQTGGEDVVVDDTTTSGIRSLAENRKGCTYYSAQNRIQQQFYADYIFDKVSEQTDVYERVAKPIVESALEGYSGLILAYGELCR